CVAYPASTVTVAASSEMDVAQQITDICPEGVPEGAVCGHIDVPLERDLPNSPNEATIPIAYELYGHTNLGPPEGVILPNFGGPGSSTTFSRDFAMFLFGPSLATHDLLLIDDRGTGMSGVVDCPELVLPISVELQVLLDAMGSCATSLGDAADDYATGDMAIDTHDVLVALGYAQADFYGLSYGGMKLFAFAARYPAMVRSMVFDSPSTPTETRPFELGQSRAKSLVPKMAVMCERSMTCSQQVPDPAGELTSLIERVRANPVDGGFDIQGDHFRATVDEKQLLEMMSWPLGPFTYGEMAAAAMAQREGDKGPLLRASAEINWAQLGTPPAETQDLSIGGQNATICDDTQAVWDWSDPVAARLADFEAARAALPEDWYAPFSKEAASSHIFDLLSMACAGWSMPSTPTPLIPAGSTFPAAPVVALEAELDSFIPHEVADDVTELFPNASLYVVKNSFHGVLPGDQSPCAQPAANEFFITLQKPTSICEPPALFLPAKGEFSTSLEDVDLSSMNLRAANEGGRRAQRTAVAAGRSVVDTLLRSALGQGDCLRGGTYRTRFADFPPVVKLVDCRVIPGIVVNGLVSWAGWIYGGDGSTDGDITVSGPGAAHGTLHLVGSYGGGGQSERLRIRGHLGGKKVALSFLSN
ncbi:MAG: hypothetical protein QOG16_891, partial [Actinomycetota bacterium]|nr:hypothetical protein [Actinomycetota bacterium]